MKILKKDIKKLEQYDSYFRTAIHHQYMRNLTNTQIDELLGIYERITGKKYKLCKTCGTAKLKFIQEVGKLYYENKTDKGL